MSPEGPNPQSLASWLADLGNAGDRRRVVFDRAADRAPQRHLPERIRSPSGSGWFSSRPWNCWPGIPTIVYGFPRDAPGHADPQGGADTARTFRSSVNNALSALHRGGDHDRIPMVSSLSEDVLSAVPRGLERGRLRPGGDQVRGFDQDRLACSAFGGDGFIHPGDQPGRGRDDGRGPRRRDESSKISLNPLTSDRDDDRLHGLGHPAATPPRRVAQVPLAVRGRVDPVLLDVDPQHRSRAIVLRRFREVYQ